MHIEAMETKALDIDDMDHVAGGINFGKMLGDFSVLTTVSANPSVAAIAVAMFAYNGEYDK